MDFYTIYFPLLVQMILLVRIPDQREVILVLGVLRVRFLPGTVRKLRERQVPTERLPRIG